MPVGGGFIVISDSSDTDEDVSFIEQPPPPKFARPTQVLQLPDPPCTICFSCWGHVSGPKRLEIEASSSAVTNSGLRALMEVAWTGCASQEENSVWGPEIILFRLTSRTVSPQIPPRSKSKKRKANDEEEGKRIQRSPATVI